MIKCFRNASCGIAQEKWTKINQTNTLEVRRKITWPYDKILKADTNYAKAQHVYFEKMPSF
jgi:hypothetical protein